MFITTGRNLPLPLFSNRNHSVCNCLKLKNLNTCISQGYRYGASMVGSCKLCYRLGSGNYGWSDSGAPSFVIWSKKPYSQYTVTKFSLLSWGSILVYVTETRIRPYMYRSPKGLQSKTVTISCIIKVDFQSLLRTLKSLFAFFVLLYVRHHKM